MEEILEMLDELTTEQLEHYLRFLLFLQDAVERTYLTGQLYTGG